MRDDQNSDIILDSISDTLKHDIVGMMQSGDEAGIRDWAKLLMVETDQLKNAARAVLLAMGLAASSANGALSEEDIPDEIRRKANQTQFARASRGEQTRGQDANRINEPRGYDDQRRGDDERRRWEDERRWRDDGRRYDGRRYDGRYDNRHGGPDPFWMVRDMQRRMRPGGGVMFNFGQPPGYGYYQDYGNPYQQQYPYYQQQPYPYQQQGSYGFADEPSPLDGGGDPEGWDQVEEPPMQRQPIAQPQQVQPAPAPAQVKTSYVPGPGSMPFKLANGKAAVFEPYPNQADLDMARKVKAPTQRVNVAGQNRQINAYVYELDDVTYVVAQPGQL